MKNLFLLTIIFLSSITLAACSNNNEISLVEGPSIQVEASDTFYDPGVNMPDGYTFYCDYSMINSRVIGKYYLEYHVLDENGVEVSLLNRIVDVIDSTPPAYILNNSNDTTYVTGREFDVEEIFESVEDNSEGDIIIENNYDEIVDFSISGEYDITITLSDTSGNFESVVYSINYIYDISNPFLILANQESDFGYVLTVWEDREDEHLVFYFTYNNQVYYLVIFPLLDTVFVGLSDNNSYYGDIYNDRRTGIAINMDENIVYIESHVMTNEYGTLLRYDVDDLETFSAIDDIYTVDHYSIDPYVFEFDTTDEIEEQKAIIYLDANFNDLYEAFEYILGFLN